jgi:hypothetical protein
MTKEQMAFVLKTRASQSAPSGAGYPELRLVRPVPIESKPPLPRRASSGPHASGPYAGAVARKTAVALRVAALLVFACLAGLFPGRPRDAHVHPMPKAAPDSQRGADPAARDASGRRAGAAALQPAAKRPVKLELLRQLLDAGRKVTTATTAAARDAPARWG